MVIWSINLEVTGEGANLGVLGSGWKAMAWFTVPGE